MEIKNAIIKDAVVEIEDHGILTASLHFDYGDSGQAFGGYALYTPSKGLNGSDITGFFISRVLETVGAYKWDALVGKAVRVKADHSHIEAVGHILKDRWFNPKEELENFERHSAA